MDATTGVALGTRSHPEIEVLPQHTGCVGVTRPAPRSASGVLHTSCDDSSHVRVERGAHPGSWPDGRPSSHPRRHPARRSCERRPPCPCERGHPIRHHSPRLRALDLAFRRGPLGRESVSGAGARIRSRAPRRRHRLGTERCSPCTGRRGRGVPWNRSGPAPAHDRTPGRLCVDVRAGDVHTLPRRCRDGRG